MSKISQELQILFYLNKKQPSGRPVSISELAEKFEICKRQVRRYVEDLNLVLSVKIQSKLGRYGGYYLTEPLNIMCFVPDNLALALSIAMKRNEKIEKVLSQLSSDLICDYIDGDNLIDITVYDNIELLFHALQNSKEVKMLYKDKPYICRPYKFLYSNTTYYLICTNTKNEKRTLNIGDMSNIEEGNYFEKSETVLEEIEKSIESYGISKGTHATLRVKCQDKETLEKFDRYFEKKGRKDYSSLIFEVDGNEEHELYYPLFRISTKKYVFLDKDFKEKYIKYLNNQIKSLERN